MQDQRALIEWREGGVPVSRRFDDPYFSLQGGLEETRHVFLAGNELPGRFRDGFRIAELGFGTGLNVLATMLAWQGQPGALRITSFEAFPMTRDDAARALAVFDDVAEPAARLIGVWDRLSEGPLDLGHGVTLEVIGGDVRDTLPRWTGQADAWFLDGFSPARNGEMWEPAVMGAVGAHTAPGGTFATYTAAGHVRAALADAGFEVTRQAGFGRKRHMTTGRRA